VVDGISKCCYNTYIDSNTLEHKMTTVAQMIEWMKTLPQDAEVQCGVEESSGYWTYMKMKPVDIECCDVFDYKDEAWKGDLDIYGKVIVNICGE
jgi:hypothetical protein